MKKFLIITLSLLMLTLPVGCSGKSDQKSPLDLPTVNQTAPLPSATPLNTPDRNALVRGSFLEGTYTSEFGGIRFTLPKGWSFASDEEIAQIMNVGADMLNDEQKFAAETSKMKTIYDMVAYNKTTNETVIVMFENLSLTPGATGIDAPAYAQILKDQLSQVEKMKYTIKDTYDLELAGETYCVLPATIEQNNAQQYYLLRKVDNYMMAILVTTVTKNGFKSITNSISE